MKRMIAISMFLLGAVYGAQAASAETLMQQASFDGFVLGAEQNGTR